MFLAITETPTGQAERELIEVVSGKRRVNKRYIREQAITALVESKSAPLLSPTKALIELRYRADGGRHYYTKVTNGKISPIWKEAEDFLPEEFAQLISEDDSF